MFLVLLSISLYMSIMWVILFYRGFLPKIKKNRAPIYDSDPILDYGYSNGDDGVPQTQHQYHRSDTNHSQSRIPQRSGATTTRSVAQQTMIQGQQNQPQLQSLLMKQFIK